MSQLPYHVARLFASGIVGVVQVTSGGRIAEANDAFLAMSGYGRKALAGLSWGDLASPDNAALDAEALERLKSGGLAAPWETELVRKDGSKMPALVGGVTIEGSNGEWAGFVLDLTERDRLREKHPSPRHQPAPVAVPQPVILERAAVLGLLDQEITKTRRSGVPLAAILASVDRFEAIKKSLGEDAAEAAFRAAVEKTRLCLRGYDGLGRLSGGELLVVLPECDQGGALAVAKRIQSTVAREPLKVAELSVSISVSAAAVSTEGFADASAHDLLQAASAGLVRAQSRGGSRVELVTA